MDQQGCRPDWAPLSIDLSRPSAARIYDYYLGGAHNFEVDRIVAREAIAMWPQLPQDMQANRTFLRRSVRYMIDRGIDQFLDIGCGIPTAGNVHDIAQAANPAARVVYVDADPVAVAHSKAILCDDPQTLVIRADMRRPPDILDNPAVRTLIDFTRPVGLLMAAVLHFISDEDDPAGLVAAFAAGLPSGSMAAISHVTPEFDPEIAAQGTELYKMTPTPLHFRQPHQVRALFGPFEPVAVADIAPGRPGCPGAVFDGNPGFGCLGRKP